MEVTGDELVMTLIMERQVDERLIIVVEGQEDCQLFDLHLLEHQAAVKLAGSKTAVLTAAELCVRDSINWAIFVVDADFSRVTKEIDSYPENVIASEYYDVMMDILVANKRLISRAIVSQALPETERNIRNLFSHELFDLLVSFALPVGILRYLVVTGVFNFSTRKWYFRNAAECYLDGTLNQFISKQGRERSNNTVSVSEIESHLDLFAMNENLKPHHLLNGHDLISAVAELIRYVSGQTISPTVLCGTVRGALECVSFRALTVVQSIEDWSRKAGCIIFDCPDTMV